MLFKQLSSFFWFCAGKRRPALVPDGERSHTADGEGTGGLCNRESSVHAQRGLAAVPGSRLQLSGTSAHTLFTPYSILHAWASLHSWNILVHQKWSQMSCVEAIIITCNAKFATCFAVLSFFQECSAWCITWYDHTPFLWNTFPTQSGSSLLVLVDSWD